MKEIKNNDAWNDDHSDIIDDVTRAINNTDEQIITTVQEMRGISIEKDYRRHKWAIIFVLLFPKWFKRASLRDVPYIAAWAFRLKNIIDKKRISK